MDPEDYEVVSPLVTPPSHHLVVPAGCCIASCRLSSSHCAALSSTCRASLLLHCLSSSSHCAALSSSCHASWLLHSLSPSSCCATLLSTRLASLLSLRLSLSSHCAPRRPLVVSSSRHLVVPPLVVLSHQLVVVPSSLVVLLLHCPLVISSCWLVVALHVLAPPSRPLCSTQPITHRP